METPTNVSALYINEIAHMLLNLRAKGSCIDLFTWLESKVEVY